MSTDPLADAQRIARAELRETRKTLAYWEGEGAGKSDADTVIAALRKNIGAFEKIVGSRDELAEWWARFSPEGRRMLLTGLSTEKAGAK